MNKYKVIFNIEKIIECNDSATALNIAKDDVSRSDLGDYNVYEEMMLLPKNVRERLHYLPPSKDRWKIRSTTFKGLAEAMASQWGDL